MASSASLLHYSSGFKIRSGHLGPSSNSSAASSSSCSSSCSSSFDKSLGFGWNWNLCNFAGMNNIWKVRSVRAQDMSTTQGNVVSPRGISNVRDEPDHLLVLVHGILARPNALSNTNSSHQGSHTSRMVPVDTMSQVLPCTGQSLHCIKLEYKQGTQPIERGRRCAEMGDLLQGIGGMPDVVSKGGGVDGDLPEVAAGSGGVAGVASSCNTYTKTFAGIDGAGKRLADEVMQVVKRTKSLKRISFLAHSLGGLFTRYAVSVLYSPAYFSSDESKNLSSSTNANSRTPCSSRQGMIAGLEPVNFITLATPHLGVRGKKQARLKAQWNPSWLKRLRQFMRIQQRVRHPDVWIHDRILPLLLGVPILEKLAPSIASIFVGRTGSQLFLTDGKPKKPPLLLRMASDCEDGKFISALGAFRCRILYANVSYDRILPPSKSLDGYKHVVDVEYYPPVSSEGPHFPPEAAKAKKAAQNAPNIENTVEYHDIMEVFSIRTEEMIRGLQQLGWKKVDVSFHSTFWPFFAHNNIHVKNEWLHNAGAGVVAHVADSLKLQEMQQDTNSFIAASL
ncbi:hydrolase-like protein family [Actinidia rufa]|uniref:Hydrolase-like protein family n=1 Tax=Actinidia rufa TaxID=165716 RepID=A0A7J0G5S7_9ERIC|nr:hydrolase-like protein family [Actinidia rufa]